jgi:hypothetical protein
MKKPKHLGIDRFIQQEEILLEFHTQIEPVTLEMVRTTIASELEILKRLVNLNAWQQTIGRERLRDYDITPEATEATRFLVDLLFKGTP